MDVASVAVASPSRVSSTDSFAADPSAGPEVAVPEVEPAVKVGASLARAVGLAAGNAGGASSVAVCSFPFEDSGGGGLGFGTANSMGDGGGSALASTFM